MALRTEARAKLAELVRSNRDPLEILCGIAADQNVDMGLRIQAASAAVVFCHPKLSQAVTVSVGAEGSNSAALLEAVNAKLSRRFGSPAPTNTPATIEGQAEQPLPPTFAGKQ